MRAELIVGAEIMMQLQWLRCTGVVSQQHAISNHWEEQEFIFCCFGHASLPLSGESETQEMLNHCGHNLTADVIAKNNAAPEDPACSSFEQEI